MSLSEDGLDRHGSVSFQTVIDEQVGRFSSPAAHGLITFADGFAGLRIRVLNTVVRSEFFHSLFVGPACAQERPDNREARRERLRDFDLFVQRRHPIPRIKDVGDTVAAQDVEVRGIEVIVIANFDRVSPGSGQSSEESIEVGEKILRAAGSSFLKMCRIQR